MIRNLKVLGLALAAVFALSAVAASAASAQTNPQGELTTEGGVPVTLTATETGAGQNAFTAFGSKVDCVGSTITGHKITATPHQLIPNKSTEITLTPHFVNCLAHDGSGTHKATVTMTSCDFHAKINKTTGGIAHTYGVNFGITCNVPGDSIHIDVFPFSGSELGGIVCSITIKEQQDLTGAHITSTTPPADNVDVSGTVLGIHAEESGSACATQTTTLAEQDIDATVKAVDAEGKSKGITITDIP